MDREQYCRPVSDQTGWAPYEPRKDWAVANLPITEFLNGTFTDALKFNLGNFKILLAV